VLLVELRAREGALALDEHLDDGGRVARRGFLTLLVPRREQRLGDLGQVRDRGTVAGGPRGDQRQGPHPVGVVERRQLRHAATLREADPVRAADVERVEQPHRVGHQVREPYDGCPGGSDVDRPVSRWS